MEGNSIQPGPSGVKRPLPTTNNNQPEVDAVPSSGLKNTLHGNIFQLKMLVLFLVRGIKSNYNFRLATERPDLADKFDDLIFEHKSEDNLKYRFLQAKHKQRDDDKIKSSHLLDDSDGDFSLLKYFSSYRNTISKVGLNQASIEDCVIATNIGFDEQELEKKGISLIPVDTSDKILDFKDSFRFKLKLESKNLDSFKKCSPSLMLAKKIIGCIRENKKMDLKNYLFARYHVALTRENVIEVLKDRKGKPTGKAKLHLDFVQRKNRWNCESAFRSEFLNNDGDWNKAFLKEFQVSTSFGREKETAKKGKFEDELPKDEAVTDEEINSFFKSKLVFAVRLPNEDKLGEILTAEIAQKFKLNEGDFQSAYILRKMLDWFKNKDSDFMTAEEGLRIFNKAQTKMTQIRVTSASLDFQEELKHCIKLELDGDVYSNDAILNLNTKLKGFLDETKFRLVFMNTPSPKLSALKINSALRHCENGPLQDRFCNDDSYLMLSSDYLISIASRRNVKKAIETDAADYLVIICCDSTVPDHVMQLAYDIQDQGTQGSNKRMIILANVDNSQEQFKENAIGLQIKTDKDDFKFDDLSEKSRKAVLGRKIIFQDQDLTVSDFQFDVAKIDSMALLDLLTLSELVIDSDPTLDEDRCGDLYIDRTFTNPIALENLKKQLVDELQLSNKICISENGYINWREIKDACEKRQILKDLKEQVYKLKKNTKNKNKRKFSEDCLIEQCTDGRIMVIADVAGTGKSTFLASLALKMRNKFPSSWVVRIKLNQHSKILDDKINFCNSVALKFLPDKLMGLDENFSKFFFNHSFRNGKVVLILDGFDEIKDNQQENIINLVNQLKNSSKMTSFCIASRQEAANDLQNEFFQFPFQLEDLNDDEQAKYLTCHWKRGMDEGHRNSEIDAARDHKINDFARNLVKVLNCKLVDTNRKNIRSFIGIPLQCFMVAECFQSKINEYILSANITMECSDDFFADIIKPEFNLLELYRQFFKRKWEIVEKEKGDNSKSNKSNVCNFTVMKETS